MKGKAPFEQVVARHGAVVQRVCRAILRAADADDAWSETFLCALRAYPALPPGANVKAWLVTIAHRKALDGVRAVTRGVRRRGTELGSELGREPAADPTSGHELLHALKQLPPKQQQAIAYHHLAGLSYTEVAAILGGSAVAARRAACDGMAILRTLYETKKEKRP